MGHTICRIYTGGLGGNWGLRADWVRVTQSIGYTCTLYAYTAKDSFELAVVRCT